jgi:hypothetical protein
MPAMRGIYEDPTQMSNESHKRAPKPLNVYLIDPEAQTITQQTMDWSSVRGAVDMINAYVGGAFDITSAPLYRQETRRFEGVSVYVNDEGALIDPDEQWTFKIGRGASARHLAGKAMVTGMADEYGDTLSCLHSLDDVVSQVQFFGLGNPVVPYFHITTF